MKKFYMFVTSLILVLSSCEKENESLAPAPITLDAEYEGYWFYNLHGEVQNLNSYTFLDFGFLISTSPSFNSDSTKELSLITGMRYPDTFQKHFTAKIPTESGKTYYYKTFLFTNDDGYNTGDTKSFIADWQAPELETVGYKYDKDKSLTLTGTVEGLAAMRNDTLLKPDDYSYGIELSMDESFNDVYYVPVDNSLPSQTAQNDTFRIEVPLFISGKTIYYRTSFRTQSNKFNISESFHSDAKDLIIDWQPSFVDLGLSVKWATCNIGGYTPSDHGDYFSWGWTGTNYYINQESITALTDWYYNKQISGWKTQYPYGYDESYYNKDYTIYTDNDTLLKLSRDAAYTLWGAEWRIPSDQEFIELRSNCTWTLETISGVDGYRITSNISGFEGNSIFLPMSQAFVSGSIQEPNTGHYWTRCIGLKSPMMSNSFYLGPNYAHDRFISLSYFGLTIRPVTQ